KVSALGKEYGSPKLARRDLKELTTTSSTGNSASAEYASNTRCTAAPRHHVHRPTPTPPCPAAAVDAMAQYSTLSIRLCQPKRYSKTPVKMIRNIMPATVAPIW